MKKRPIFCDIRPAQDEPLLRRNHNCPEYDDCLSIAAFADLDLDCSFCSLKNANQAGLMISEMDIIGCLTLTNAVFYPKEL